MAEFLEGKDVLFQVAGNIYIVGDCHYGSSDNLNFEPPSLRISPSDSVLLSIKRLFVGYDFDLKYSDDNFVSLSNILEEEDDGRINLLHNQAIHKTYGKIPFSGDIKELFLLPKYDFFVAGQYGVERFRMIAPKNIETGLGRILYKEKPLHRKVKIRDLFGETSYIKLTHVGSPNVAFTPRIEWDIVDYLESEKSRKIVECIIKECPFYKKEVITKLLNSELVFLHALTHSQNFPASLDDIFYGLDTAEESCVETMCRCSRELLDANEVEETLYNLRDRGVIFEDNGLFGRTKEDFEEKEDSEEDTEIKDHPDQLYFDFYKLL